MEESWEFAGLAQYKRSLFVREGGPREKVNGYNRI